jgi:hypothetical protein
MRNPLANVAASPKENLMVRPSKQMLLLLRAASRVFCPRKRLYGAPQPPHVRSQEMSGPSSDAARGPSLTQMYGPAARCKRFSSI